ncbi:hypothetical protein ABC347_13205 [Sphingomonas sp. 1P06PA]|uniref:hypothetical protein n=1 Tax=Sphingomonas sp. 1P06PA TaxID=554121 RepID=UPI0039A4EB8F
MTIRILVMLLALAACDAPPAGQTTPQPDATPVANDQTARDRSTPSIPPPRASATSLPAPKPFDAQQLQVYPNAARLPADVQQFVARHEDCQHWRSEPSFDDPARAKDIAVAAAETCAGIDALAVSLKARYRGDARVSAALARYPEIGS